MVNRERFRLDDIDSEGFPIANLAVHNIGKVPDVQMAQAILADHACQHCNPGELSDADKAFVERHEALHREIGKVATRGLHYGNPKGWDEVDGIKLPTITWADEHGGSTVEEKQSFADMMAGQREKGDALRAIVNAADINALANISTDGISRLSDSTCEDPFFGWKL